MINIFNGNAFTITLMSDVTVVVPSYNHAPFVEETLRSIFAQSHQPKKLIVIDDGSKDESAAVIERVLADCPFPSELTVRLNRGLCATLNESFARADGDYFAYIGSDDVWLPTMLAEQISLLDSRPEAVLAFGHSYLIDEDDNILDSTANWSDFADGNMLPTLLKGQIFSSPSVVYRRSVLEKYRWNEDSILEDYELYLRLAAAAEFARNSNVVGAWRQHGSNVSGDFPRMMSEWIAAQDRVASELPMSREELDRIQAELKFESIAGFVRGGHKREAIELFRENIGGARSISQIAKTLARLAVPKALFAANRRRKRQRAIEKYGKLVL